MSEPTEVPKQCIVEGCTNPRRERGRSGEFCRMHHTRNQKHGNPLFVSRPGPKPGTPRVIRDDANTGYTCPSCEVGKTQVVDSRQAEDGTTRRRRKCPMCSFRFSTMEIPTTTIIPLNERDQYKLFKKMIPRLLAFGDWLDELRAEHEP